MKAKTKIFWENVGGCTLVVSALIFIISFYGMIESLFPTKGETDITSFYHSFIYFAISTLTILGLLFWQRIVNFFKCN